VTQVGEQLRAPFPYFGGKSTIAAEVWARLGNVPNYVEPFFGSGAVLLARPHEPQTETINDVDGYIANFWRAVAAAPEAVARYADWPVNENDLHARHAWLVQRKDSLAARLEGDPEYYDAKIAGWWCWGMCCWIGGGFCGGDGPWQQVDGQLIHLGDKGRGVNRQRIHLGNKGRGVNRQLIRDGIYEWMAALSERMRRVRVCCGDWSRVCGPTPTIGNGLTGVFLDPPYGEKAGRADGLYASDDLDVAPSVCKWAIEQGNDPMMRIAFCGYEGEHVVPENWECLAWKARGGFSSQGRKQNDNPRRERIWFSPHCLRPETERGLFDVLTPPPACSRGET
jgi:hypothetical protein